MSDIALYYPHMWMRDEAWIKAALLYWPRIARMVPSDGDYGYGAVSSSPEPPPGPWRGCWPREVFDRLGGARSDVLLDLSVGRVEREVAVELTEVVEIFADDLRDRYGIAGILGEVPRYGYLRNARGTENRWSGLEWVHWNKMTWSLRKALIDTGLAASENHWLGMHPRLAWVYMCALADRLAHRNQMAAVTDEVHVHSALNGWTVDTIAKALLEAVPDGATRSRGAEEVGLLFTVMAATTVVPKGLAQIPLDRILAAREALLPEMYAYRRYLHTFAERFATLAAVEDPAVLNDHLETIVRGEIEPRVVDLESRMRAVGFQPVRSVLGMKALAPSALMAAGAHLVGVPPVISASGAVAACFVGAAADARQRAREASNASPVSYLLHLKHELRVRDSLSRSRAVLARRR